MKLHLDCWVSDQESRRGRADKFVLQEGISRQHHPKGFNTYAEGGIQREHPGQMVQHQALQFGKAEVFVLQGGISRWHTIRRASIRTLRGISNRSTRDRWYTRHCSWIPIHRLTRHSILGLCRV